MTDGVDCERFCRTQAKAVELEKTLMKETNMNKPFESVLFTQVYPVTILKDRYGGTYSRAEWTAFNLHEYEVGETDANGGDVECAQFWDAPGMPAGKGNTPQEAYEDLIKQVKTSKA